MFHGLKSRLETTKESVSELEHKSIELSNLKIKENSVKEMNRVSLTCDKYELVNIHAKKRKRIGQKIFGEIFHQFDD